MVLRVEKGSFVASADMRSVTVWTHHVTPAGAEVRVTIALRGAMAEPEVRGRLVGPRCPYASTVEVAYPFRTLPRELPHVLTARVIIPEPSLWEPTCPFLYEGPLELWHNGSRACVWQVRHGLRSVHLGPGGLRWNGQPFQLRGQARQQVAEADALALRQGGYNSLLVGLSGQTGPDPGETAALCAAADRFGFLVLARVPNSPDAITWARGLSDHACFLGWLLPQGRVEQDPSRTAALAEFGKQTGSLLGVELTGPLPPQRLAGMAFVCCREELLPALGQVTLPKLVLTDSGPLTDAAAPGTFGYIRA